MDKQKFVHELARYLVEKQVNNSIKLTVDPGDREMLQWVALRATTPLFGYPSVDDATKELAEWLGIHLGE